jgi:protein-tyrosine kinase
MGKISDALQKITKERNNKKKEPTTIESVSRQEAKAALADEELPESALATVDSNLSLRKKLREARFTLEERLRHKERMDIVEASDDSGIDPRVITYHKYHSPMSEQYRSLRINIRTYFKRNISSGKLKMSRPQSASRMFAVTSSLQGEGKTVTSVNLAVSLANEFDVKVLLVDCDLRKGSVDTLLGIKHKPGLFDVIAGKATISEVIQKTVINNLFVIPTGDTPLKPSELLGSRRMKNILEQIKGEGYSYVIFDTPPALPFSDAGILGSQIDGVIMVVQSEKTQAQTVRKALESLEHSHTKVLGCVLTHAEHASPQMYGHYYYYYAGKGNGKRKKESDNN